MIENRPTQYMASLALGMALLLGACSTGRVPETTRAPGKDPMVQPTAPKPEQPPAPQATVAEQTSESVTASEETPASAASASPESAAPIAQPIKPVQPATAAPLVAPTPPAPSATAAAPQTAPAAASTAARPATPPPSNPPSSAHSQPSTAPKPTSASPAPVAVNSAVPPKPPAASAGHLISGSVELVAKGRQKLRPGEVSDSVIYFRPSTSAAAPKPGRHTMYTRNKAFDPALLVVQQGSTVAFPNSDPILHNVYSNSPGQEFDFGFYGEGETREQVFNRPGLVLVSCNVHHVMAANVLVLDTPYFTRPDASGHFELRNLPSGLGELVFWHPRGSARTQAVAIPSQGEVRQSLEINRPPLGVARR